MTATLDTPIVLPDAPPVALPDYDPAWHLTDEDFAIFARLDTFALLQVLGAHWHYPRCLSHYRVNPRCTDAGRRGACPLGVAVNARVYVMTGVPLSGQVTTYLLGPYVYGDTLHEQVTTEAERFMMTWDAGRIPAAALQTGLSRILARRA
jgi:hypothetical protein